MTTSPTTRLDAVNTMVRAIGATPLNTLTDVRAADALIAIDVLDDVMREVQLQGWRFNRDVAYPIQAQAAAPFNLFIPDNVLSITPNECETGYNIAIRGDRVYDLDNHTYSFPDIAPIKFDIVWLLDFDLMPESMRRYIAIRAARKFQDDVVGDQAQHAYKERDETRARLLVEREERRNNPLNMFSNISSQAILRRHIR